MMQIVVGCGVLPDIAQLRRAGDGETIFEMPPSLPNGMLLLPCTPYTTFIAMSLRLCMDLKCNNNKRKNIIDIISNMLDNGPLLGRLSFGTPSSTIPYGWLHVPIDMAQGSGNRGYWTKEL